MSLSLHGSYLERFKELLAIVFKHLPISIFLFWLSYYAIVSFGIPFIFDPTLFEIQSYAALKQICPSELVWGISFVSLGLGSLLAILTSKKAPLIVATSLHCVAWTIITSSLYLASGKFTSGVAIYSTFSLASYWIFLRITTSRL